MRLREELVEVVGHALERLKPVAIGVGVGHCPVGANRRELVFDKLGNSEIKLGRNPYGVTDKDLYVEGGYEVKSSPFAPSAAETVVRKTLEMLHDLQ
jgi:hypothetical protein